MFTAFRTAKPSQFLKGATGDWEVIIGLEVHAQVASNAKLFSGASTEFGGAPNDHVSLVDAAMPGMLPVINEECVAQAVRTGLGLEAEINLRSVFDRKNYFYPDLPQGYQISQYKSPIVGEGVVHLDMPDGEVVEVGVERLHLEQDAGKSIHDQSPVSTFVDLNRSGVALMEIVSKPDMRSGDEAKAYLSKLRTILRYLGTCDGDMDKGNMRADVNVSVRKPGGDLGTRCEIKNVNSIRFVGQAIDYEARRQIGILEDGGTIKQETRLFDSVKGETRSMRSKEEAHDYRYFPDPDLLPLEFSQAWVDELKSRLPELPDAKKARFKDPDKGYGLREKIADLLCEEREIADAFEDAVFEAIAKRTSRDVAYKTLSTRLVWPEGVATGFNSLPQDLSATEHDILWGTAESVANLVVGQLFAFAKDSEKPVPDLIRSVDFGGLLRALLDTKAISSKIAKDVFDILMREGGSAEEIVESRGLKQVTDTGAIEAAVDAVIAANPDKVEQIKVKPTMSGWFVGQVMKQTGGKANPQAVNEILKAKLGLE